jgi:hypothetical protein
MAPLAKTGKLIGDIRLAGRNEYEKRNRVGRG